VGKRINWGKKKKKCIGGKTKVAAKRETKQKKKRLKKRESRVLEKVGSTPWKRKRSFRGFEIRQTRKEGEQK